MHDLELRRLERRDATEVHRIVAGEEAFRVSAGDLSVWHAQEIVDWLDSDDPCYGAFCGHAAVGVCLTHFHKAARKLHVENLKVEVQWRRKRIGSRLLELAVAEARQRVVGGLRVVALAKMDNLPILKLLSSADWARGDTVVWMQRDLSLESDCPGGGV